MGAEVDMLCIWIGGGIRVGGVDATTLIGENGLLEIGDDC
jgi:hypothetical protein